MTVTIPRAELNALAERHGDFFGLDEDPPVTWARDLAAEYRHNASDRRVLTAAEGADMLAEADDLDALADRYERKVVS
jgi:hypothetical protein